MLFPTLDYLLFLPVAALLYWFVPRRARLAVLALASIVFYASWRLEYLAVLLAVVAVAWGGALLLERRRLAGGSLRPVYALVVPLLLAPLIVFKYWNWLAGDLQVFLAQHGVNISLPDIDLPLPIGISFFTFQAVAYLVDVGRQDPAERDFLRFSTFIGFFPQLVAGPIVRRSELLPQLEKLGDFAAGQVGKGLFRIGRGLLKKIVLADILRVGIVDPLFTDPENFTGIELLIGLYAYTLQIYYDFSGYTDIAIGSALLFGISLPENFRRPYKAINVTDFWRRWHITLSLWVRHYVYFPMGGARGAAARVYFNLMCVFIIIGVWHGASWSFVAYGALHGAAMMVNRWFRKRHGRDPEEVPSGSANWKVASSITTGFLVAAGIAAASGWAAGAWLLATAGFLAAALARRGLWARLWRVLLTLHFVVLARILFRAEDFAKSKTYFEGLWDSTLLMPRFSLLALLIMVVGFAIHFSPDRWQRWAEGLFASRIDEDAPTALQDFVRGPMRSPWAPLIWALILAFVAFLCLALGTGEQLSFIYYSF